MNVNDTLQRHVIIRLACKWHVDVQLCTHSMADIDTTQPVHVDDVQPEINNDEEDESKACLSNPQFFLLTQFF